MLREIQTEREVIVGAEQTTKYFPLLKNKTIAVVANQTSLIKTTHLVDSLIAAKIKIKCVFAPEHGFRGEAGAGEKIANTVDVKTGILVYSLYGTNHKPENGDLSGVDFVLFDIQDVGARFYTYISTLHLVMESCAENHIQLIILDRPNPNGHYVDGPVLDKKFASFVGMSPVPIVHGLTVGEYAQMVNGESWLSNNVKCQLKIIKCINYDHRTFYSLPIKPSPNLPNMPAVYLYPTLCLFEGTMISVGRGTQFPFQVLGYPGFKEGEFAFTPVSIAGVVKDPPYKDTECRGIDLREFGNEYIKNYRGLYLYWLKGFYDTYPDKSKFFISFFDKLAGTDKLRQQITDGWSEEKIRQSWQEDLKKYKMLRKKYLLYEDFE
ncbi:MAG: exo-beta-N-acetylmuramidase NamZ domain-containing protein [Bacteroidia bacterium]